MIRDGWRRNANSWMVAVTRHYGSEHLKAVSDCISRRTLPEVAR